MKYIIYITPLIEQRVTKSLGTMSSLGFKVEVLTGGIRGYMNANLPKDVRIRKYRYLVNAQIPDPMMFSDVKKSLLSLPKQEPYAIIFRDILLYGTFGELTKKLFSKTNIIVDIADNYEYVVEDIFPKLSLKGLLLKMFIRKSLKLLKQVDHVLVVCKENAERISRSYGIKPSKIHVLENLPLKTFSNNSLPKDKKIPESIVYSGLIDERIRDLSEVLLAIKGTTWSLHLYPTNPNSKHVKNLKKLSYKLDIAKQVVFHEPVPFSESVRVLAKYVFGIIPHRNINTVRYTLPNKLYDYILAGIPILVKDVEILRDYVESHKIGLSYSNPDSLRALLLKSKNKIQDFQDELRTMAETIDWDHQALNLFSTILS